MIAISRLISWMSSLKISIGLLITIAISSGIGTTIPQGEAKNNYLSLYDQTPWLGLLNGQNIINLQFDHIYTSTWFIGLLVWLGLSLTICSFKRQIPSLKSAIQWIDYKDPKQIKKLAIAQAINIENQDINIDKLADYLQQEGWKIKKENQRFAARKGIIGKFGPPLVHLGLVLLMVGSTWGGLFGEKLEQFLITGKSIQLINNQSNNQLEISLEEFNIDRDPAGRPEQFRSRIKINDETSNTITLREISVNHPLRYKGITFYQADWSLSSIRLQVDKSDPITLPLQRFPELGEEIWGIVLPTNIDGTDPILLSASKEDGPVKAFNENGEPIASLKPGDDFVSIKGILVKVLNIIPSSGLLIKRDPGVPLVYSSFAITLIGGILSILSTRKLWAINDSNQNIIYFGGLCNRNPSNLANELTKVVKKFSTK